MGAVDSSCPECGSELLHADVRCPQCATELSDSGTLQMVGRVVLDQYEIESVLGQGGMSVVYNARHKLTGQKVALKLLPPDLAAHSQVKSRFIEEAKAMAQLDHPNIVHLYNFGQDQNSFVLAMQFIEGRTWEDIILRDGISDWQRSVQIAIDVLSALEFAHGRGVVHRDMKPSNVLVRDSDGSACVMDFGIAKVQSSDRLTATGQTMGTVRYMSPEQVRGLDIDHRTDIYSLAATLYEAVVGDTPFDGQTHFEVMTKHLNEPPVPPSRRGARIPRKLDEVIVAGLAKSPDDRPESAAAMKAVLQTCLAGAAATAPRLLARRTKAPPPGQGKKSPRAVYLAGSLAAILVGVAATAVVAMRADAPVEESRTPPSVDDAARTEEPPEVEPFLLTGLELERADFREERLSVYAADLSIAESIRDEYAGSVAELREYFASRGVSEPVPVDQMHVVLAPRETLCGRALYQGDADESFQEEGCATGSWYRALERTLYIDRGEPKAKWRRAVLRDAVLIHACTHWKGRSDCLDIGRGFMAASD